MVSLAVVVAISASIMRAVSTLNENRFEPKYFTRNHKMPFEELLKFLLSMYKTSSQSALNKFFESKGITISVIHIARSKAERQDLTFVVDNQMQLETIKPFHGTFTCFRIFAENAMIMYSVIITHLQGSGINKRYSGTLAKTGTYGV